jgi:hypothetical protein
MLKSFTVYQIMCNWIFETLQPIKPKLCETELSQMCFEWTDYEK